MTQGLHGQRMVGTRVMCFHRKLSLTRSQKNESELWSTTDDDRLVGDVPQGNGILKQFSKEMWTKVNNYCMMNSDAMQKWYDMYERTRLERMHAREEWSQRNWGIPYPKSLQNLPKSMSASWIWGKIASAKANGEPISLDK